MSERRAPRSPSIGRLDHVALTVRDPETTMDLDIARSDLLSVYVRDPDGNLVEIANELPDAGDV